ncbi:MAG: hypothetical protein ABFC56_07595, partial [Clostridiaceae bacterium]
PNDVNLEEWAIAVQEQIQSFTNSLDETKAKKAFNFKEPLVKQGGYFVYETEVAAGDIQKIVLKHIKVLSSICRSEQPVVKLPKGNVAKYKYLIRSKLPVSSYIGQLNLFPGKFNQVKAVKMS